MLDVRLQGSLCGANYLLWAVSAAHVVVLFYGADSRVKALCGRQAQRLLLLSVLDRGAIPPE